MFISFHKLSAEEVMQVSFCNLLLC